MQATGNRFEISELRNSSLFKRRRFSLASQATEGEQQEDDIEPCMLSTDNSLSPKLASALFSKSESSICIVTAVVDVCTALPPENQQTGEVQTQEEAVLEGQGEVAPDAAAVDGSTKEMAQDEVKKKRKGFLNLKGRLERMSLSKPQKIPQKGKDDTDKPDKDMSASPQPSERLGSSSSSSIRTSKENIMKPSPASRKRLNSSPHNSPGRANPNTYNAAPTRSCSEPLDLRASLESAPSPTPSPTMGSYMDASDDQGDELRRSKNLERFFGDVPQPSKKFEKILGDSPTTVFDRNTAHEFEDDEESVEIQEEGVVYCPRKKKGGLPIIKGATLPKLIEKLTHHAESDPNFQNQFLYTYRLFTTPQELLDLLKKRFEVIEAGKGEEDSTFTKNKQVVRLRVFNVLKSWLQYHWVDFQDDPALVDSVMLFTDGLARDMNMAAKTTLVRILSRNKEGEKEIKLVFSKAPPEPHPFTCPRDKLSLLEIHPEEFARQLTLLEHEAYKAIKPWEFLLHTRGQKKSTAILAMINRFNDVSQWVQTEILRAGETPKQRAVTLSRLLDICMYLKELKNYNALMEIISGMNASAIFRLKLTWAALPAKVQEGFGELNTLVSANAAYKNLRTMLRNIVPPCIPYMGMYLTDLTFINDGNNPFLDNGYINFDKCRRLSAVIQDVVQYQQTPYCLKPVPEIQDYIRTLEFEKDADKIYKMSLYLEERGSVRL